MSIIAAVEPLRAGWLLDRRFDIVFILGVAALALASGFAVVMEPSLFVPILIADLWLLGYHHVIATFTRIAFDRDSFQAHRNLVLWLPLAVLAGTALLAFAFGGWAVATLYLYWQWFHYTRQSWGISRAYSRKAGTGAEDACSGRLFWAAFYGVPLWGILERSAQAPTVFLGLEIRTLPVPPLVADLVGIAAIGALIAWLVVSFAGPRARRVTAAQATYLVTHYVVFSVGYVLIRDITYGWLVINVWHNAQYILFVWLANRRRFEGGVNPRARFISWLSQPGRGWIYGLVCLGLSTAVYMALAGTLNGVEVWALPAALIVFQTANFHHYIVDGLIWRSRRPAARA